MGEIKMAKSTKRRPPLASFDFPVKVEVRKPEVQLNDSIGALDVERLSKGSHKIEIGFVKGGCCPQRVRAVIKRGMVIGCEVEPCSEQPTVALSPEFLALVDTATRQIQTGKKWQPIPVSEFVSSGGSIVQGLIIETDDFSCIHIKVFFDEIICCQDLHGGWYCFRSKFPPPILPGGPNLPQISS